MWYNIMYSEQGCEEATAWAPRDLEREEWANSMRMATESVVDSLSAMHESLAARGFTTDRVKVVELTTAIAQLIQIQETLNHKLFTRLVQVTSANSKLDCRLTVIERALDESPTPLSDYPKSHHSPPQLPTGPQTVLRNPDNSSPPRAPRSPVIQTIQTCKEKLGSFKKSNDCSKTRDDNQLEKPRINARDSLRGGGHAGTVLTKNRVSTDDSNALDVNACKRNEGITPRLVKRRRNTPALSNVIQHESSKQTMPAHVPTPKGKDVLATRVKPFNVSVNLPALPTLSDVVAEMESDRRRERISQRQEPPACDKCRILKRADMLRQRGYIDEAVFERWAAKPGGCLGYIHMDEPGAPPSPLSFPETATCSPPKLL